MYFTRFFNQGVKAMQNKKVMFVINPEIMRIAKAAYKDGKFYAASNSAFLRDVLETIYNKVKMV